MITTTLGLVADAVQAVAAVMALPLPSPVAYRLSKLGRRVMDEARDFDAQRGASVRRLGEQVGDTDQWKFEGPNKDVFTDEFNALCAIPVTIDAAPISLKSLAQHNVSAAHLSALEAAGLLVDDTAEVTP
jgi:hypothetical protein